MRTIFYLIILLITQSFFAQSAFEKGNDLYQKGKYNEALIAYESILKNHQQSSELYFNIGNCYYKLNKVAPTIYNYEKALVLCPTNTDALNNLKFAQKKTIDEIKVVPKVGFSKLIHDFTSKHHYNSWAWIAICFSVLFLLVFIGYYFSQITIYKRLFFFGMFLFLLLLIISVSSAIFEKNQFLSERPAVVFSEVAQVRGEPQKGSSSVFVLHEGTKVYILEAVPNWKKIQLTDGTEGWIESSTIKEVK